MQGESEEQIKGAYRVALGFYNKSLLSLKMIFEAQGESAVVTDNKTAADLIKNIEMPVSLNLALCHLKIESYHYAIFYCGKVLDLIDRIDGNSFQVNKEKALYRRGYSFLKIGSLDKAKADLLLAKEIGEGKNP